MLCDPTRVFEFDFSQDIPTAAKESFRLTPHSDGIAHGMAFLFDPRLSPEVTLSTSPGAQRTHWHQAAYILPEPMEIKQNESVRPFASQDHSKISLLLKGREKHYYAKDGAISSAKRCICSLTISCGLRPTLKYRMTSSIPEA